MTIVLRKNSECIFYNIEFSKIENPDYWRCVDDIGLYFKEHLPEKYFTLIQNYYWSVLEPFRSFTVSGDCWQKIGFHGVFDLNKALEVIGILILYAKDYNFRIQEIEIKEKTIKEILSK